MDKERLQKLTYSVPEAAIVLGISNPHMYELTHRADFPAFKIGHRTLISKAGLDAWVKAQGENREGIA